MIDQITASQNIDPNRVYVVGFSAGGFITYFVACELSTKVAAVAVISNQMTVENRMPCEPRRPVSELAFVGTADQLIPPVGKCDLPVRARDGEALGDAGRLLNADALEPVGCRSFAGVGALSGRERRAPLHDRRRTAYVARHTGAAAVGPRLPGRRLARDLDVLRVAPGSRGLPVTVPTVHVAGTGTSRRLTAVLRANRAITARVTVTDGGKTVASTAFTKSAPLTLVRLALRGPLDPGALRVTVAATDAYGELRKVSKVARLS